MSSLSKFVRFSSVVLVVGSALAGCGASVPEATDEEIIALLGEGMGTGEGAPPATINSGAVECAEMLSGLNEALIKDMPAEMLGMAKTRCREAFNRFIADSTRNPKGFKLEHFENKDFARRIAAAAEKSRAIYAEFDAKRTAEREAREAEERAQRIAEAEKELAADKAAFEQSLAGYDSLADEFIAMCGQVKEAIAALKARDRNNNAFLPYGVGDCNQRREEIIKAADDNRALWAAVEVYDGFTQAGYKKPYIAEHGFGTVKGLESMIASLKTTLESFNRRLGRE